MKTQTQIEWWFPAGFRLVYSGSPKSRWQWVWLTWTGYVAMWRLLFRVVGLMNPQKATPQNLHRMGLLSEDK